jgi:hypothetical protein
VNNFEVITTPDKETRDRLFEDLRTNGNELERKVVKFSGNEPVLNEIGQQDYRFTFYEGSRNPQPRPIYRSNWSIAYPKS